MVDTWRCTTTGAGPVNVLDLWISTVFRACDSPAPVMHHNDHLLLLILELHLEYFWIL